MASETKEGSMFDSLTEGEMKVVKLVIRGLTWKRICEILSVKPENLRIKKHRIKKKLNGIPTWGWGLLYAEEMKARETNESNDLHTHGN